MGNCENCLIKPLTTLRFLSKEELKIISEKKVLKKVSKGRTLFSEGENLSGLFCVREGICKLSKLSENGKDQIVKIVTKGNFIGKRSTISDEPTNLSAKALTPMEVCFIPKKEFMESLYKNSNFSIEFLKLMASDLRESDNLIVNMAQKSVKQRLAETLLYIQENLGVDNDGWLNAVLTRQDYSNIVGTATESIIRILKQFQKDQIISTLGKKIKIQDVYALKHIQ